jgi:hypothetical protein
VGHYPETFSFSFSSSRLVRYWDQVIFSLNTKVSIRVTRIEKARRHRMALFGDEQKLLLLQSLSSSAVLDPSLLKLEQMGYAGTESNDYSDYTNAHTDPWVAGKP